MALVTDSSNVMAVGYAPAREILRMRFRDGSEYEYSNVSADTYAELMGAPSIGVHFAATIRGKHDLYPCERKRRPRTRATAS